MSGSAILATAQRAFDSIPFYRELYGVRPGRDDDVPFIPPAAYHRAAGPMDVIASASKVLGAVPSFRRGISRLPLTVLESEEEWRARVARLGGALGDLGCPVASGLRFAVVADEATGPFASELSNSLAWDRTECAIVFASGAARSAIAMLAAIAPDVVIVATSAVLAEEFEPVGARVIAVEHITALAPRLVPFDRLLVSDEVWVMGAAQAGDEIYRCDGGSLLFETEPWSGQLAVTVPAFTLFALVRYCLGGGLAVAGADRLRHA